VLSQTQWLFQHNRPVKVWIWNSHQKFMCSRPDPQGSSVQRWGLWEMIRSWGFDLMNKFVH
jgi:hypothetical protein